MSGPNGKAMLDRVRQCRPFLLACEAIGWLHMTGKAHPDFLRDHGGAGVDYEPKDWHKALRPAWSDRLAWVRSRSGATPLPVTLTDFLEKYDDGRSHDNLVGLLQAAHAMASGIEKNLPTATSVYLSQDVTHMWLASPFGHPVRNLLADPPPVLLPGAFQSLLERIGKLLDDLHELAETAGNVVDPWWRWREAAIGPDGWLREAFLSTLAETRLPNNDVTLWDQSYVAAALFKSAVAGALLAGCKEWKDLKSKTRWRVLTIGFGSRHYESRAVKIGDWVGARRDIDKFFDDVRRLIEVDLAIGSLVYRDDETSAFAFPGLRFDATSQDPEGSLDDASAEALRGAIEAEVDGYAKSYKFETPPLVLLGDSTRSFVGMVAELRKARADLAIPVYRHWEIPDGGEGSGHVCPVCQVRFNQARKEDRTENARKQRVCRVCADRRTGRLDAWLASGEDTIWISEVADENDRVALLSLSLDIEAWVGGERVDSLRAQSIAEWRQSNAVLSRYWERDRTKQDPIDNPICVESARDRLLIHVTGILESAASNRYALASRDPDRVLANLQEGYRFESSLKDFFEKIVEDRSDAPKWEELDDAARASWIVHQLFRKLPSPGRIYRFWRTAEAFFEVLHTRFRELAAAHSNRWRTRRLVLQPDKAAVASAWEDRETYSGRWRDAPLDLLYRADEGNFVTISNLARCFDASETAEVLAGQTLGLAADGGVIRSLTITSTAVPEGLGCYSPVILLDRSPLRFRVLVPLDRVTQCIETAIATWQEEFACVWDRIPLRVAVVAFPRITPFQAVVEAARNLEAALDNPGAEEATWGVADVRTRDGMTALSLERPGGGREMVLLPTRLPDGREDVFYPYVRVEDREVRFPRDFVHPHGQVYRHALDLRRGDGLVVNPSRLAAIFLDTTARRFDRPTTWPLAEFQRMREIWELIVRVAPSLTAARGAWSELAERSRAWRDPAGRWLSEGKEQWLKLARGVLPDRLGASGAALETLVEAARDGLLEWALEWHLTWLKEPWEEQR